MDEGNNSGVTGVIDLPGQGAKFSVWARGHTTELTAALMDAAGRGDSEWPEQRPLSSGGFVSVGGSVSLDGWPTPDKFRGELGTLTLQQNTGVTLTLPVRVREVTLKKSSKEQGLWDVTAVCQIVGDPVSAGFAGSQPVAATETFGDKALWAGMTKTVDPQGLQSAAAARMLVWGTGDSDAAEKTKIDAILGAIAAPYAGMKARAAAFQRLSKNACLVDVSFGLTDTAEDVVNPETQTTLDPQNLASVATSAAINGTPATPSGAAFKARGTSTKELNDAKVLSTTAWGLNDTKDDAENERVTTTTDAEHIADVAVRAQVWATAGSAPATPTDAPANNVKLVGVTDVPLNPGEKLRVWAYGPKSSRDELVIPQTETVADANGLQGSAIRAYLDGESAPAAPAGLVYRTTRTAPVTVGLGVNRTLTVDVYGVRSTTADVEQPKTETDVHATYRFEETAMRSKVWAAGGTAPTAPDDVPANNAKLIGYTDAPVTAALNLRVWMYGPANARDKAVLPRLVATSDPNGLEGESVTAWLGGIDAEPAAPAGMVLRFSHTYTITENLPIQNGVLGVKIWGYRSTADDLVLPKTWTLTDPQGLASMASAAALNATPTLPGGFVSRGTRAETVAGTNVLTVIEGGLRSTLQDIEFPGTRHRVDVSAQIDADTVTTVTSGASWTPPTNAGSLVLRDYERRQEVPGVYVFESSYGLWTRDAELVAKASRTTAPAARGRIDLDAVLASGTAAGSVNLGGTVTASIDPTASIETAAVAVRTALLNDATFEAVDVERVTPSKLLLNLHRRGTQWWMELESHTYTGLLAPWRLTGGGVVQVFVADVVKITSGLWAYVIGEVPAACTIMDFTIWKTYTGDSLYTNANAAGLTNNDIFMGFAALTVAFAGVTGPVAIKDSYRYPSATNLAAVAFEGARTQGWKFRFDSRGQVAADGICPGYVAYTTTDLSAVSPRTWVNASTLGVSAASATPLDFTNAFLNTTP